MNGMTTPTTKKYVGASAAGVHNNSNDVMQLTGGDQSELANSPQRKNKGYEYWLEAECLLKGHGIEPNKEYAITWFERSANQGEPRALNALGCIYEQGIGVRIDKNKAVDYFRQAALLNESHAQYKLGKYYL